MCSFTRLIYALLPLVFEAWNFIFSCLLALEILWYYSFCNLASPLFVRSRHSSNLIFIISSCYMARNIKAWFSLSFTCLHSVRCRLTRISLKFGFSR
jgi:hypothetical protein